LLYQKNIPGSKSAHYRGPGLGDHLFTENMIQAHSEMQRLMPDIEEVEIIAI
jgi:hypothetical protein